MSVTSPARDLPPYIGDGCPLTPRQLEVVRHLSEGKTLGDAARAMGTSYNTVRNHVDMARFNTGTTSNEELTALAVRRGWLP